MFSAGTLYRLGEGFTRFRVLPQFLKRDPQGVGRRWALVFAQLDRRAEFGYGFAAPAELVVADANVEMGASLMLSGPTQCGAVFKDGLFERPSVKMIIASVDRSDYVSDLGFDAQGACHQNKQQKCDANSNAHAPSFSLLTGESG
jgi:hypothetical protein